MKKILSMLSILILFSATGISAFADENNLPASDQNATDHVIVTLKEDANVNMKNATAVSSNVQSDSQVVTMEVPADQSLDAFIDQLEKNEDIQNVEPDYLVELSYSPNDPQLSKSQYYHQKIETKFAWDQTRGSEDVVVAVIDDGIDMSHPDLKNQIIHPFDTVKENGDIAVGLHGTHVAGIIGSSINNGIGGAGVAPNAKIMPINVFDGEFAYTSEIIQGIYYAINQGADVINLSLGSYSYSSAFNTAIQDAHKKGIVIVAAAGNEKKSAPFYPAAYPNVISVASTTSADQISSFSNFGETVDITAPGSSIYSTLPKGGYGFLDGTSMATPIVSGVAALIKSSDPTLSNRDIENRLFATAVDLGAVGKDPIFGHGRVNARKALLMEYIAAPSVAIVFQHSTAVKGTAKAGSKITVRKGSSIVYTGQADSTGKFSVTIPKQPVGTKLIVFSTNPAGADSTEKEFIVKDGIAPAIPSVNSVSSLSTSITGKAETGARVYAFAGKVKLGEAVAKSGAYSINIGKQKAGTSIAVYAVDAAKNKSAVKTIKVVTAATRTSTYTTSTNLNMRSGASLSNKVITVVPKGAKVQYVKKSGSWVNVKYGSKTGWVYGSYLK